MRNDDFTRYRALVNRGLDEILPSADERPEVLHEAMRYAVDSGGKRLRPVLCLAAAEAVGGRAEDALYPACAIELLHNYTLIHDDLPAMDNDVERRGKPTVWKAYGEANAILAGDALLALAYEAAASAPRNVRNIVSILGKAGVNVVRGQVEDLAPTADPTEADVDFVYLHKTADLFIAAAAMGAFAAGATKKTVKNLALYALHLGLAFQFRDDLLDGDSPYDRETTESLVQDHTAAAIAALEPVKGKTDFLINLAERLTERKK